MAKAGETDPRWIVEQREDWANVNNWHWTERDFSDWAFGHVQSLLLNTIYKNDIKIDIKNDRKNDNVKNDSKNFVKIDVKNRKFEYKVTKVEVDGVATLQIRKGKIKKIHDLEIEIDIELKINENVVKISISIPEFSFDTGVDKIKFIIKNSDFSSCDSIKNDADSIINDVKSTFHTHFSPLFKKFLDDFYTQCDTVKLPQKVDSVEISDKFKDDRHFVVKSEDLVREAVKDTKNLELEQIFHCPIDFLYDLFSNQEKISMYTQSKSIFKLQNNFEFSMLNSVISGKILEFEVNKLIKMTWRFKEWPTDYYSTVTLTFSATSEGILLKLQQMNIPYNDYVRVSEGWNRYFFQPIQMMFGIGASGVNRSFL